MPARWLTTHGEIDGLPSTLTARIDLEPTPDLPQRITVRWTYTGDASGLPTPVDDTEMSDLEETLLEALGEDDLAVLACTLTHDHTRTWTFYATDDPETLDACLADAIPDGLPIEVEITEDPDWDEYLTRTENAGHA